MTLYIFHITERKLQADTLNKQIKNETFEEFSNQVRKMLLDSIHCICISVSPSEFQEKLVAVMICPMFNFSSDFFGFSDRWS